VVLLAAGIAYFVYMWRFDPDVLEHGPGDPDMFTDHAGG